MESHQVVVAVTLTLAAMSTFIGNGLVLAVRVFKRNAITPYKLLTVHLAIADLTFGLKIPFDMAALVHNGTWKFGVGSCKFISTLSSAAVTSSIGIIVVMAYERYKGIKSPIDHLWTFRNVNLICAGVWAFALATLVPYAIALTLIDGKYCSDDNYVSNIFRQCYQVFLFATSFIAPFSLIVFFHWRIFQLLRQRNQRVRALSGMSMSQTDLDQSSSTDAGHIQSHNVKLIRITLLVAIAFGICSLPSQIYYLVVEMSNRNVSVMTSKPLIVLYAAAYLTYFHSALNPLIYSIIDQRFRKDVKDLFKCIRYRGLQHMSTRNRSNTERE